MRAGVLQLHHWGLLDDIRRRGTPTVFSTSFHYGDEVMRVELKPRDGVDGLCAPRRFVLDALLVEAARGAGAEVVHGVAVTDVVRSSDGRVTGVVVRNLGDQAIATIPAGLVVGADGMRSTVANLVGATPTRTAHHMTAVIFSYFAGLELEGYHWYYRPGVSVGTIPTNDGLTCVFASIPPKRFHEELAADVEASHTRVLGECNAELAATVARGTRTERYRGFPGVLGYSRRSAGPGWTLVGDAGYFKDPLTAHGMTDALVDAEHLARAAATGRDDALATYERERNDRALAFFEITDAIASFAWDLPTVQKLHRNLSDEMKREAAGVLALHSR